MNLGIDFKNDKSNDDENEEDSGEADVNNNDATLGDKDVGIIINYGPIEYYEFNIPITVGNFSKGGRRVVFGFYRQFEKPFKKGRKKLGIICVLCSKALYGTTYYYWTWVKCEIFITNNITNLLFHL